MKNKFRVFITLFCFVFFYEQLIASWTAPITISAPSANSTDQKVATNAFGNAVAVWTRFVSPNTVLELATYDVVSMVWSDSQVLSMPGENAANPHVIMSKNGSIFVIWQNSTKSVIQMRMFDAVSMKWSSPFTLSAPSKGGGIGGMHPRINIDGKGNAIAVWLYQEQLFGKCLVQACAFDASAMACSSPVNLTTSASDVEFMDVAVAENGNAIISWLFSDGGVQTAFYSNENRTFTANQIISTNEAIFGPEVAIDKNGNAICIWCEFQGSSKVSIVAAAFDAASLTWSAPFNLAESGPIGEAFDSPQVAMNASGDIAVVWRKFFLATPGPIQARTYNAAMKTWTPDLEHPPADLSLPGAGQPQVGISTYGNALAVWGINDAVEARVYNTVTKSWALTSTLSTDQQSVTPQFSMSSAGNGFVIWGNFSLGKVIQAVTNYNLCPVPVAPLNFVGKINKKDFLGQMTCSLNLIWEASPSPSVVKYRLYKGDIVVGEFVIEKGSQMNIYFRVVGENEEQLTVTAVSDDNVESDRIPLVVE